MEQLTGIINSTIYEEIWHCCKLQDVYLQLLTGGEGGFTGGVEVGDEWYGDTGFCVLPPLEGTQPRGVIALGGGR